MLLCSLFDTIGAGAGTANKVWKAQTIEGPHTRAFVAIKQIDLMSVGEKANVQKECMSMSLMATSPNVVDFHCSFVSNDFLWLVMALEEGLMKIFTTHFRFSEGCVKVEVSKWICR